MFLWFFFLCFLCFEFGILFSCGTVFADLVVCMHCVSGFCLIFWNIMWGICSGFLFILILGLWVFAFLSMIYWIHLLGFYKCRERNRKRFFVLLWNFALLNELGTGKFVLFCLFQYKIVQGKRPYVSEVCFSRETWIRGGIKNWWDMIYFV